MFGGILFRMILWELMKVFGVGLVALTGIMLTAGVIAEASQHGFSPAQVLAIAPLLVPSCLPYTIPTGALFAVCVVYGRLAHDNEVLAIRSAGVNMLRVLGPALFLGLAVSAATMLLYYRLIPYTHHLVRSMFLKDVEEFLYAMIKKDGQLQHPKLNCVMFVHRVQGRKLLDVTFKRRGKNGQWDFVARAREAELLVEVAQRQVLVQMRDGVVTGSDSGTHGYFEEKTTRVDLPSAFVEGPRRARDLTWSQLLRRRDAVRAEVDELTKELERPSDELLAVHNEADLPKHFASIRELLKSHHYEILSINAELVMRPALSLGCLCFVLVGCPVGVWFSRSDYLSGFITCFLPIVFVYYPLLLCGTNLAKDGKIDPVVSVWAADVVVALAGAFLAWRMSRR